MERRIFMHRAKELPSFGEMAERDDSPEARPMQPAMGERGAKFIDKSAGQQFAPRRLAQSVVNEFSERPLHPRFHRQNKPALRTIINGNGQKIAAQFHQPSLGPAMAGLFLPRRQTEHVLDQLDRKSTRLNSSH